MPIDTWLMAPHTRDIVLSLVVNNFGIRYTKRSDADHLIATLQTAYEVRLN